MGLSLQRLLGNIIVFPFLRHLLLLLLLATHLNAVYGNSNDIGHHDDEDPVHRGNGRKLLMQPSTLTVVETGLLTNDGDVLSLEAGRRTSSNYYTIYGLALSMDENVIFYLERTFAVDIFNGTQVFQYRVKKVDMSIPLSSSSTNNVFTVAGPWSQPNSLGSNSSTLTDLLMLDATTLLVADMENFLVRNLNVNTGEQVSSTRVRNPLGLSKDPTDSYLYVSSFDRIYKASSSSSSPDSRSVVPTLAGPSTTLFNYSYADDSNSSEVRFNWPLIGSRSISANGSSLYVSDRDNSVIRRVSAATGATTTIAGIVSNITILNDTDGSPLKEATFGAPLAPALTADGCNLFVPEWYGAAIRWLTFERPDGDVIEVKTVATIKDGDGTTGRVGAIMLSSNDTFLYVGTFLGQIFKLELNRSALHRCTAPAPAPSSSQPSPIEGSIESSKAPPNPSINTPVSSESGPTSSKSPSNARSSTNNNNTGVIVGVSVSVAVLAVCTLIGVCIFCGPAVRQRLVGHKSLDDINIVALANDHHGGGSTHLSSSQGQVSSSVMGSGAQNKTSPLSIYTIKEFSLFELRKATENFDSYHLVEAGGYGDVYRASLAIDNKEMDVAIKVMRGEFDELKYKQFIAEVNTMSRVAQKNLCKLVGYCTEEDRCILVYPFFSGGSVYDRLHNVRQRGEQQRQQDSQNCGRDDGDDRTLSLNWTDRMSIAEQIAAGLRYLHHDMEPPVLHRDVKSKNVLTERVNGKLLVYLIDFGLARSGNATADGYFGGGETVATLTRSGTPGYMAPEYAIETKLTMMNDVYAFGVVLLELVTGRKAVMRAEDGTPVFLVAWARQWLSKPDLPYSELAKIVDPSLLDKLTSKEWEMVFKLAMLGYTCTQDLPKKRFSMEKSLTIIRECKPY